MNRAAVSFKGELYFVPSHSSVRLLTVNSFHFGDTITLSDDTKKKHCIIYRQNEQTFILTLFNTPKLYLKVGRHNYKLLRKNYKLEKLFKGLEYEDLYFQKKRNKPATVGGSKAFWPKAYRQGIESHSRTTWYG